MNAHGAVRPGTPSAAVCRAADPRAAAQASDRRSAGKALYDEELLAVPRREGGRRGLRRPASAAPAAQLHDRQVQDPHHAQRRAAHAPGPRSTSSGTACRTRRCPPGRTHRSRRRRTRGLRHVASRRTSPSRRRPRKPIASRAPRRSPHESVEQGKKIYARPAAPTATATLGRGDGPSAPTLKDDWQPDPRRGPSQPWTFRGGAIARGYLPDDEHRAQRHAHAVVRRRAQAGAALGDHRLHRSLSAPSGRRLHQPGRRQARRGSDRCRPRGPPASPGRRRRAFRSSGRSWSRGASSIRPRRGDRAAPSTMQDSIAFLVRWHDMTRRRHGQERPVAPGAAGGGGRGARAAAAPAAGGDVWGEAADPAPAAAPAGDDVWGESAGGAAAAPAGSEFSDAVAVQIPFAGAARRPQALLHLRRRAELRRSLVLRSRRHRGPREQFTGKGSASITAHEATEPKASRATTRATWSVIFKRPLRSSLGRQLHPGPVRARRVLGLGRLLARARQPPGSHASGLRVHSSRRASLAVVPDG